MFQMYRTNVQDCPFKHEVPVIVIVHHHTIVKSMVYSIVMSSNEKNIGKNTG